jgi:hypothetical protein
MKFGDDIRRLQQRIATDPRCSELLALARIAGQWSSDALGGLPRLQTIRNSVAQHSLESRFEIAGYVCLAMAFIGLLALREPVQPKTAKVTPPPPAKVETVQPAPRAVIAQAPVATEAPKPAVAAVVAAVQSPEPVDEVSRIRARYLTAREACLARLHETAEYRSARAEADRLEAIVRTLRVKDARSELGRVSVEWIQAKSVVSTLTAVALNSDPEVQEAEQVLRGLGLMRSPYSNRRPTNPSEPVMDEPAGSELSSSDDTLGGAMPSP